MSTSRISPYRIGFLCIGMLVVCVVLVLRVGALTLFDPYSVANRYGSVSTHINDKRPAERGAIEDRHGVPLAMHRECFDVVVDVRQMLRGTERKVAFRLAELLDEEYEGLTRRLLSPGGLKWIYVKRDVSLCVVEDLEADPTPGIVVEYNRRRIYPQATLASSLLGYIDKADRPQRGLESAYAKQMEGSITKPEVQRDGRLSRAEVDWTRRNMRGADMILTLDSYLQRRTEEVLEHTCQIHQATGACAVVLDHKTGDVLALASYPLYDPNDYSDYWRNAPQSFINRAVESTFEPGSTMKSLIYAFALDAQVISPTTVIDCERGTYVWVENGRRHRVRDKSHPHGMLTAKEVMQKSSNVGAAKMGQMLGRQRLYDNLTRLGFGRPAEIGVSGERRGILRPTSQWWPPMMENIAFGHGMTVTAVQLAQAYGALANDGMMHPPRLVKAWRSNMDGRVHHETRPEPVRVMSERAAQLTLQAMASVVTQGTGRNARVPGYTTAGKTGTANKVDPIRGGYSTSLIMASFAGMVPAYDPAVTIVVMVDEPSAGQTYGGQVAAPAWAEIAAFCVAYLGVPPDNLDDQHMADAAGTR